MAQLRCPFKPVQGEFPVIFERCALSVKRRQRELALGIILQCIRFEEGFGPRLINGHSEFTGGEDLREIECASGKSGVGRLLEPLDTLKLLGRRSTAQQQDP